MALHTVAPATNKTDPLLFRKRQATAALEILKGWVGLDSTARTMAERVIALFPEVYVPEGDGRGRRIAAAVKVARSEYTTAQFRAERPAITSGAGAALQALVAAHDVIKPPTPAASKLVIPRPSAPRKAARRG